MKLILFVSLLLLTNALDMRISDFPKQEPLNPTEEEEKILNIIGKKQNGEFTYNGEHYEFLSMEYLEGHSRMWLASIQKGGVRGTARETSLRRGFIMAYRSMMMQLERQKK